MEQTKTHNSRLYNTTVIESKRDDFEEKFERGLSTVESLVGGMSETEAHDAFNAAVARDKISEELVITGLLAKVLTRPSDASIAWRDLTLICRDGLHLVQQIILQLTAERWSKLTATVRDQVLWATRELMRPALPGLDTLLWTLMRYMAGGDISQSNIYLIECVLDILIEYRNWVEKSQFMVATSVYTFLRLAEDHMTPNFNPLLQREISFAVSLLRARFTDCLMIGRDLIRLLQNVARVPSVEILWKDLLQNPQSFSPTFSGIVSILESRTSRRFLQSRLTPDMEQKIVFLTSSVRFGQHKRYQDWFHKQYLGTAESQSLRCDLIRFIVGVIHPTNELLSSDIIPRWAVIGWLLTTCPTATGAANAKLALFYDWLFYQPDRDNIMNIEPAILVIHNSLRSHPAVTATLLDFLCRIMTEFYPGQADRVRMGVNTSLRQIVEKRVLPRLYPLFTNAALDQGLRALIRESFPDFSFQPPMEGGRVDDGDCTPWVEESNENHCNDRDEEAMFSDDENDHIPPPSIDPTSNSIKGKTNKKVVSSKKKVEVSEVEKEEIKVQKEIKLELKEIKDIEIKKEPINLVIPKELDGAIRTAVENLHKETDNELKCEAMERLLQIVIQDEDEENEYIVHVAKVLCQILQSNFDEKVFPESVSPESLEDSIGSPVFVLMRNLVELTSVSNYGRYSLSLLLAHMATTQPRIGYLLLYYILASSASAEEHRESNSKNSSRNDRMLTYKEFCQNCDKTLEECLMDDMKQCQEDDVYMLCWLVPGVYTEFDNIAVGDANLLNIVVSSVDARQLQELVCLIVQGRLVMVDEACIASVLTSSLMWETFEQMSLWQIVSAHALPIEPILPLLTKLDFASHAEALTNILLMLQQEKPRSELVKAVLMRDVGPQCDSFVASVLLCWCREDTELVSELVATLLSSRCPAGGTAASAASPGKRKRATTRASAAPTADRILGHLERLRAGPKGLYKTELMQRALALAKSACTESQKTQFSSLFALLEFEDGGKGKSQSRGRRQPTQPSSKRAAPKEYTVISSDSEESSLEEETSRKGKGKAKAPTKKKRKVVNSDSD